MALTEGSHLQFLTAEPDQLPVCHRRADYPDPCITAEQSLTELVRFEAPFVPDPGVP